MMTIHRTTTTGRLAAAALAAVLGLGAAACTAGGPTTDADLDDGQEGVGTGDTGEISDLDTDGVTGNESNLEDPGAGQVGTDDTGDPADDGDGY